MRALDVNHRVMLSNGSAARVSGKHACTIALCNVEFRGLVNLYIADNSKVGNDVATYLSIDDATKL